MNFNGLEQQAQLAIDGGRLPDAIAIFTIMATGDASLDAGYLGERLGECYERLGWWYVARYWYERAVEENPDVRVGAKAALVRLAEWDGTEFLGGSESATKELREGASA